MRYPRKGSGVLSREVEEKGEGILLDRRNRSMVHLNPVAWDVWRLCDGTRSPSEIVDQVARIYAVSKEQASRDIIDLLEEMENQSLVEEDTAPAYSTHDLGCKYCDKKALSEELEQRLKHS